MVRNTSTMKIAVSGLSGLIGQSLNTEFLSRGWSVVSISRKELYAGGEPLLDRLCGADAVIHLSGAPILRRWTKRYKKEMTESRVTTTQNLAQAVAVMPVPPKVFISTSAVGIYSGEGIHTETRANYADDFLGDLCRQWEAAAQIVSGLTRLCIFRLGIVLAAEGGALKTMALPFRLGVGGPVGTGRQMTSWIHIDDLVEAFVFALVNEISGVFNLTSPQSVSNREFSRTLASAMKRTSWLRVPGIALRLLYGEGAGVLTSGQVAVPENLLKAGFEFRFPEINQALKQLLKSK